MADRGENARLHSGIVSQKKTTTNGAISVRASVRVSEITEVSAVFIENMFAGFMMPNTNWVALPDPDFVTQATRILLEVPAPADASGGAQQGHTDPSV